MLTPSNVPSRVAHYGGRPDSSRPAVYVRSWDRRRGNRGGASAATTPSTDRLGSGRDCGYRCADRGAGGWRGRCWPSRERSTRKLWVFPSGDEFDRSPEATCLSRRRTERRPLCRRPRTGTDSPTLAERTLPGRCWHRRSRLHRRRRSCDASRARPARQFGDRSERGRLLRAGGPNEDLPRTEELCRS
jgi:hypothetical protein